MKIFQSKMAPFDETWAFNLGILVHQCLLYFLALIGPTLLLFKIGTSRPLLSLAVAVLGWHAAAIVAAAFVVMTKRLFLRDLEPGRYAYNDPKIRSWIVALTLHDLFVNGPFWRMVTTYYLSRYLYFKGMGAKIDTSFYAASGTQITDPWAITAGHFTTIGLGAVVSAHKLDHGMLTYEPVSIGRNVTLGARSVVLPGARIGDGATVNMNSVVWPGTVIPPDEVWSGNPAQKVDFALLRKVAASRPVKTPKDQP